MKTVRLFSLTSLLLGAVVFTGQAFATPCPTAPTAGATMNGSPVCIASYGSDGNGTGLEDKFAAGSNPNSIFTPSSPGISPYVGQVQTPNWSVDGSSGSVSTILLQIAGNANQDMFGIYDPSNPSNQLVIFSDGQTGNSATLSVFINGGYSVNDGNNPQVTFSSTNLFGYFLTTPNGATFYSNPLLNETSGLYPDGTPHMVAYQGNGTNTLLPFGNKPGGVWASNEYIQAWEDLPFASSDLDYNDFVVLVESVHPVPEPAVLGMFGLGVLMIGLFVGIRRRRYNG